MGLLKGARYTLNGAPHDISTDAFMLYGFELATAHAVMTEWADQDLKARVEELHDVRQKLHVVAQRRDGAEAASPLKV